MKKNLVKSNIFCCPEVQISLDFIDFAMLISLVACHKGIISVHVTNQKGAMLYTVHSANALLVLRRYIANVLLVLNCRNKIQRFF